MPHIALDTPLFEVLGAKSAFLKRLETLGIKNVRDLLWHFPARYEDFTKVYSIAELEPGQQATVQGIVEEVHLRRTWRRQMSIVEATIADATGSVRAVWFNQPYLATVLKVGRTANFSGKVSMSEENELYLNHPTHEVVRGGATNGEASETSHTARLVPIYPETRGLTSRGLRFIIQSILKKMPEMKEWIPEETLATLSVPELNDAIRAIHFPENLDDAFAAQKRFSFEELFLLQLFNLQQKLKLAAEHAPTIPADVEKMKVMLAALPFELTPSQKKSLWEIMKDIERPRPMNRLLQGDVGSGKTVVAALAAMVAAGNGYQTAFMAPTEILARQHFETMKGLLRKLSGGTTIGLVTGSTAVIFYENDVEAKATKTEFAKKVADGEIAIIFGTHALIQKSVQFKNLGLVIVDEQHRFGVRQRAELITKHAGGGTKKDGTGAGAHGAHMAPHFLSMSATPIPRTLMLTVFGDLDLSLITELPSGRKPIETKIVSPLERNPMYDFVRKEVKNGRQVFVICPRIEPPKEDEENAASATGGAAGRLKQWMMMQKLEMKSVKEEYERLSEKIFPDLRIALLHGQMKAKEKEETMRAFKDKKFDILVATSVVEVGVDVPNATIMLIEGADRFGLAQLYQFRGRVGRGEHQSYCYLLTDSKSESAAARLRAILEAKNGFELAEKDLALRGPGQFFGDVQTGLPDIAMSALQNPELVKTSREAAVAAVTADPGFKHHPLLRKRLEEFRARIHQE